MDLTPLMLGEKKHIVFKMFVESLNPNLNLDFQN